MSLYQSSHGTRLRWRCARLFRGRGRGFSLVELLVVIGIIVLLASILLVVVAGANRRAKVTQTLATMQKFSGACDEFLNAHGRYPGIIPDEVQAATTGPDLTGTELALLDMLGGARVLSPFDITPGGDSAAEVEYAAFDEDVEYTFGASGNLWMVKIDFERIGEGPLIDGRPYAPYISLSESEFAPAGGQLFVADADRQMPDLLDAWGQPIIYLRRSRSIGPLVGHMTTPPPSPLPQFWFDVATPYLGSPGLGEVGENQAPIGNESGALPSLLWCDENGDVAAENDRNARLAQIIRAPAIGEAAPDPDVAEWLASLTPRGEYVLISAGADGVYFSIGDGPGTPQAPIADIVTNGDPEFNNPGVVEEYDDVLRFGGG